MNNIQRLTVNYTATAVINALFSLPEPIALRFLEHISCLLDAAGSDSIIT